MFRSLRERVGEFFSSGSTPAPITEESSLNDLLLQYPQVYEFIERRYGIRLEAKEKMLSLKAFVDKFNLPPPQIFFMEVQMNSRAQGVNEITAREAKKLLDERKEFALLDVREQWEIDIAKISESQRLTPELLDEMLTEWNKEKPILVYCHFGVRSLDAATFLADRGFKCVYTLQGGIDAWAQDIDPTLKRYDQNYC